MPNAWFTRKNDVSMGEMEEYYRSNPALFERRRLYRLTAFTIQNSDMNDRLSADLDNAHSEDAVRGVLQKHEIKFTTQQINSAAEELPLDKVEAFSKAKVGDLIVAEQRRWIDITLVGCRGRRAATYFRARETDDRAVSDCGSKCEGCRRIPQRLERDRENCLLTLDSPRMRSR